MSFYLVRKIKMPVEYEETLLEVVVVPEKNYKMYHQLTVYVFSLPELVQDNEKHKPP